MVCSGGGGRVLRTGAVQAEGQPAPVQRPHFLLQLADESAQAVAQLGLGGLRGVKAVAWPESRVLRAFTAVKARIGNK